jgi:hypothetical protein
MSFSTFKEVLVRRMPKFEFLEMMPGNWTSRPTQQIPMPVVDGTEVIIQLRSEEPIEGNPSDFRRNRHRQY